MPSLDNLITAKREIYHTVTFCFFEAFDEEARFRFLSSPSPRRALMRTVKAGDRRDLVVVGAGR